MQINTRIMNLIGNTTDLINWDTVIEQLATSEGNTLQYTTDSFNPKLPGFAKMDKVWQEAGYKYGDPSIEWTNYFPGTNFDRSIVDTFESIVGAKPWMVWISKIRPGKMAPWHFDAHSNIDEALALGTPIRFTCYIQDPHPGHVSIVENVAIYYASKGSIYQWSNHDAWHSGMNGGLVDKYMFNYWGYN